MNSSTLLLVVLFMTLLSYWFGMYRAVHATGVQGQAKRLESLPGQFGLLTAFCCGIPALLCLAIWTIFEPAILETLLLQGFPEQVRNLEANRLGLYLNEIRLMAQHDIASDDLSAKAEAARRLSGLMATASWVKAALVLLCAMTSVMLIVRRFGLKYQARVRTEQVVKGFLMASSVIAILTTLGIILSVLFESLAFFSKVSPMELLFGTQWSPQIAMRADQVGASGAFGAVPLFVGTLLITAIAMFIAVPVGLMTAIYLSNYASPKFRSIAKPMLELLAGIPTVVYGFFAALTVAPFIRNLGDAVGLSVASESALAAGIVIGIMIIPFVSSLSDDALNAVPKSLKDGSLGLGATLSETIRLVLLPAAVPGIVGAILLAISRAIGETMIVVMAAGLAANLTINPLESVTTVTVQIVTLLTGDQEFNSPKTLAAFALGLMLFVTTLALNVFALKVVRKYREQYD